MVLIREDLALTCTPTVDIWQDQRHFWSPHLGVGCRCGYLADKGRHITKHYAVHRTDPKTKKSPAQNSTVGVPWPSNWGKGSIQIVFVVLQRPVSLTPFHPGSVVYSSVSSFKTLLPSPQGLLPSLIQTGGFSWLSVPSNWKEKSHPVVFTWLITKREEKMFSLKAIVCARWYFKKMYSLGY